MFTMETKQFEITYKLKYIYISKMYLNYLMHKCTTYINTYKYIEIQNYYKYRK